MMDVSDLSRGQIKERRFMQVDKKTRWPWLPCDLVIYEEILFAFVADLSVLTFILFIKKKNWALISSVSGHDKYISYVPNPIISNLFPFQHGAENISLICSFQLF